jgi:hypothetical protein
MDLFEPMPMTPIAPPPDFKAVYWRSLAFGPVLSDLRHFVVSKSPDEILIEALELCLEIEADYRRKLMQAGEPVPASAVSSDTRQFIRVWTHNGKSLAVLDQIDAAERRDLFEEYWRDIGGEG